MSTRLSAARTISASIDCPPDRVYEFVSDPRNLPRWSFFRAVTRAGQEWRAETPDGPVGFRFVERNTLGVLDHVVTLGSGEEVRVPMRVVPNGDGSEVLLTVFRSPGATEEALLADAQQVEKDLTTLKRLLEQSAAAAPVRPEG
jgi:uncharacterized protein YndB with AHSA1/START domain